MKPVFTADDFPDLPLPRLAAAMANNKISAILKDALRVYRSEANGEWSSGDQYQRHVAFAAHTALIWPPSIEPIVQEHECRPAMSRAGNLNWQVNTDRLGKIVCSTCGVELEQKAKWERKEK